MILLAGFLFGVFMLLFAEPWLRPWLDRRDVPQRLLDRMQEEWDREGEPPRLDDRMPW